MTLADSSPDRKQVARAASALHVPRDLARRLLALGGDRRIALLRALLDTERTTSVTVDLPISHPLPDLASVPPHQGAITPAIRPAQAAEAIANGVVSDAFAALLDARDAYESSIRALAAATAAVTDIARAEAVTDSP